MLSVTALMAASLLVAVTALLLTVQVARPQPVRPRRTPTHPADRHRRS